ncbi:hypothetical protein [Vibrio diazotrophicus]|uniref:hypothetical protein n=1 Tax=Vibrio diazotrophicus TaxID=685 RepID=UPI000C9EA48A|nr:hypothetical protein [Vibrio diazotrophicus]PNH94609.1 hypothetical protein C1M59_00795 [Vibrio diazotrophicus]
MQEEIKSYRLFKNSKYMVGCIPAIIIITIIAGYICTRVFFVNYELEYAIYTIISIISTSLLLYLVNSKSIKTIYFVFIVLFFVSYILKFYVMIYVTYFNDVVIYKLVLFSPKILKYMGQENLINAFKITSITYFCLSILASVDFRTISDKSKQIYQQRRIASKSNIVAMCVVVLIFFFVISLARKLLSENNQDSYFIVLSTYFVPLMFIYLLNASLVSGYFSLSKSISYMFILIGLIQFAIFTSKLYVVLPFVWVIIFQFTYKVKIINNKLMILLSIPLIVLYPILNIYREASLDGGAHVLISVLDRFMEAEGNYIISGILSILYRLVGIESLLVLIAEKSTAYANYGLVSVLTQEQSITQILTYDILGYDFVMGVAPTLLGQAYFITGSTVISSIVVVAYVYLVSNIYRKLICQSSILIKTLVIYFVLYSVVFFNEGILLSSLKYQLFGIIMFILFHHLFSTKKIKL